MKHKVAIIGTGPAGYSAGIYTARAELKPIIFAGSEPGGQLMKTTEVENYPGFPEGIEGPKLMSAMQNQATRFGAELVWETVLRLRLGPAGCFVLETDAGSKYEAESVILSMGARPKMMGIGEDKYWGRGFSTCAVCDAAFYRGKNVYVVGGGDSAIEDAWALTKFASSVTMLVRGEEFRASRAMQKRVLDNPDKIKVMWKTSLKEIKGERVEKLVIDTAGQVQEVEAEGLFFAIGHEPATGFLDGSGVELDERGYVKVGFEIPSMTSVPGVFAGGDCVDHRYRQAVTAAGLGVMAALDAERWLERSK